MTNRFGVLGTEAGGVFFTERTIAGVAEKIGRVEASISGQNRTLTDVKAKLAGMARRRGANAVMEFRYTQKAHKWWELIFTLKWDTEGWHGEGIAVRAVESDHAAF